MLSDINSFHTERYYDELKRQGCEVMLASVERGELEQTPLVRLSGVATIDYNLSVGRVRKLIEQFQPDVVCAHFACGYGMLAAKALKQNPPSLALVLWGSDVLVVPKKSSYQKSKTVTALKRADLVFGDSRYLLDEAAKLYPLKKAQVAQWGIEKQFIALHKKSYGLNRPLKIIVPRLQEEIYNNSFIVEALSDLLEEGRITLTTAGFGSQLEQIKSQAAHYGDAITFYPKKTRADFLAFMSEHDIYLSASRSDSSPVSLIEAMALGLIPIAADIEGVREWLNSDTGFLSPQNDRVALRGIVEKLIDDDDPHEQMRKNNLEQVKQRAIFETSMAEQIASMKNLVGWSNG